MYFPKINNPMTSTQQCTMLNWRVFWWILWHTFPHSKNETCITLLVTTSAHTFCSWLAPATYRKHVCSIFSEFGLALDRKLYTDSQETTHFFTHLLCVTNSEIHFSGSDPPNGKWGWESGSLDFYVPYNNTCTFLIAADNQPSSIKRELKKSKVIWFRRTYVLQALDWRSGWWN